MDALQWLTGPQTIVGWLFILLHLLSLIACGIIVHEYKVVDTKYGHLEEILRTDTTLVHPVHRRLLLWTYGIGSVVLLLVSGALLFFQPHLL